MPTPPPRKRFQFHLSTAIVMMFVAGGLIWANVHVMAYSFEGYPRYGWPYRAIFNNSVLVPEGTHLFHVRCSDDLYFIGVARLSANALTAVALLIVVYFLCEWLIRRRAARK